MEKLRIWDLPTRLFHWGFALAVIGAIVTNLLEEINKETKDFHGRLCSLETKLIEKKGQ